MKKRPPEPRKSPSQGRSKILVNAIIEACQRILTEEGIEELTTNRIADVAGVTVGSLYQYFPNKEAILANLFSEKIAAETDQISRDTSIRVASKVNVSLRSTLRELIHIGAELHLRYLKIHGTFYREYYDFFDFHAEVDTRVTQVYNQPSWDEWLLDLLKKYRSELTVTDLRQAAFLTANIIDRLLEAALEDQPDWLADESYLQNIEIAAINFLTGKRELGAHP
jgi:AcrR family transcriptional regulator